jgi:Tetratricopeptide repeat
MAANASVALIRGARVGIAGQLAMLVAERSARRNVRMTDCEGACGEGFDAALAGRFEEAERRFRTAIEGYTPGTRDVGAARAMFNLAACTLALGRDEESDEWGRRALQAAPGEDVLRSYGDRASPMSRDLRAFRAALAQVR